MMVHSRIDFSVLKLEQKFRQAVRNRFNNFLSLIDIGFGGIPYGSGAGIPAEPLLIAYRRGLLEIPENEIGFLKMDILFGFIHLDEIGP